MAWIKSHQSLERHPKLYRLMDKLGIHKAQAIGHLHCFWWWALEYAPSGDISNLTIKEIARGGQCDEDAQKFINALIYSGFVEKDDAGMRIHDWERYAGDYQRGIEKQQRYRDKKKAKNDVTVTVTDSLRNDYVTVTAKSRVDKIRKEEQLLCGSPHESETLKTSIDPPLEKPQTNALVDEIYAAYPRHVAPDAAKKAIAKALKVLPFEELLKRTKQYATSPAGQNGQFTPHPATWFNRGGYNDDPSEWNRSDAHRGVDSVARVRDPNRQLTAEQSAALDAEIRRRRLGQADTTVGGSEHDQLQLG